MTMTWSRRRTLIAGLALIALTNAVALGGVAVGGIVYVVGVTILKIPEIRMVTGAVMRRIKK